MGEFEFETTIDLYMFDIATNEKGKKSIVVSFNPYAKDYISRGMKPYAVFDKKTGLWITGNEADLTRQIAKMMHNDIFEFQKQVSGPANKIPIDGGDPLYPRVKSSKENFYKIKDMLPNLCENAEIVLDNKIIFANDEIKREDYATKKLKHARVEGPIDNYNKLIHSVLPDDEIEKMEWCMGALLAGDQTKIQHMLVLYGAPKSGKSSIMDIYRAMLGGGNIKEGYVTNVSLNALADPSNTFSVSNYYDGNPLALFDDDGDLSKIVAQQILNEVITGVRMKVNQKHRDYISIRPNALLVMASNNPVDVSADGGMLRRIIDVETNPDIYGGLPNKEWHDCEKKIVKFELGAIASHCLELYLNNKEKYVNYQSQRQLEKSDLLYGFLSDNLLYLNKEDETDLKTLWENYKHQLDEYGVKYIPNYKDFRNLVKPYFKEIKKDNHSKRWVGVGLVINKFENNIIFSNEEVKEDTGLKLDCTESLLDEMLATCPAQYAKDGLDIPRMSWDKVKTNLSTIDTKKVHYVLVPDNHIVIDFDIKDSDGKKCAKMNLEEAAKWPATYAEMSKGGSGVHLHYIYTGDVDMLASCADNPNIEIKVFKGKSALRRKLTKCNDIPVATLSDLPYKRKEKRMVDNYILKDEKHLRNIIAKALKKQDNVGGTKCEIDWIFKNLEDAYKSGMVYDVTDLKGPITTFAFSSTNHAAECAALVLKMHFKSEEDVSGNELYSSDKLAFFDCEVFPNLFIICYMFEDETVPHQLINPTQEEVEKLIRERLVGFNCRDYDNHMLYAKAVLGYSNEKLFELSHTLTNQDLTNEEKRRAKFGAAYDLSYIDVMEYYNITEKFKSLKKWEVELGINHVENEYAWDQPLPEEHWQEVADYCSNDVLATKAVFEATKTEYAVRKMLVRLAGGKAKMNDTTNSLIRQIIFEGNKKPQGEFNYRNLAEPCEGKPSFPGYSFEYDPKVKKYVSKYKGIEVGEGGLVYAEPGMYFNVALLDVASMHPTSIIEENLFGDYYTNRFKEIKDSRLCVKHKDLETLKTKLGGVIYDIIIEDNLGEDDMGDLAHALKIVINSVYGLTAASFDDPFRDPRNKDNIVAKRGALFMVDLKEAVEAKGFKVAHIKTDSIKIPDATPEIIQFVMDFGKKYGYSFEHEATYERMCLVNDAVYIAKYKEKDGKPCDKWTATGAQFQHPYVFKTMFSHEPIIFEDICETKNVSSGAAIYMKDKAGNYIFVGKVGKFIPVKNGYELYRRSIDKKTGEEKYASLTGTVGYSFIDATQYNGCSIDEIKDVDYDGYFKDLCDKAYENMEHYGDPIAFTMDPSYYISSKEEIVLPF